MSFSFGQPLERIGGCSFFFFFFFFFIYKKKKKRLTVRERSTCSRPSGQRTQIDEALPTHARSQHPNRAVSEGDVRGKATTSPRQACGGGGRGGERELASVVTPEKTQCLKRWSEMRRFSIFEEVGASEGSPAWMHRSAEDPPLCAFVLPPTSRSREPARVVTVHSTARPRSAPRSMPVSRILQK